MSKTLVPPAPSSRFDGAAKQKTNPASRTLPPLDAAFLSRIYRSMAWSALFAAVLAATTMDVGGVLCIAGGFGLAALLLRTQEILVRAVVRPKTELAGFDPRLILVLVLPLKYLVVGGLMAALYYFELIRPGALALGFFLGQLVIVAKVAGWLLVRRAATIRSAKR